MGSTNLIKILLKYDNAFLLLKCAKQTSIYIFKILITEIYRQRKRSKSKVKTQERKSETEDDRHLTASTTSKTASAVLGGASKSSQESD